MKVLIPNFNAPDSFVDNVAHTLRAMGHEVVTRAPRSNALVAHPAYRIATSLRQKLWPHTLTPAETWLVEQVRRDPPDLLLALTQQIGSEALDEVRRLGVRHRVAWWGDTPANMTGLGLLAEGWTHVYLKDHLAVSKFVRLGRRASLLPEAMNPDWHRPLARASSDRVVVAGTFYGYRQALVTELMRRGVAVELYGGRLPRWASPEIRAAHSGRFVVRDDKSRVFGAGLACLNSTSLSEGDSLNCRAFEIAGAGGLHVLEYRPAVEACFEPGREVLTFDTVDEAVDLLARAIREPEWAQQIRDAGARRALAEHTYRHRLDRILADLQTS